MKDEEPVAPVVGFATVAVENAGADIPVFLVVVSVIVAVVAVVFGHE